MKPQSDMCPVCPAHLRHTGHIADVCRARALRSRGAAHRAPPDANPQSFDAPCGRVPEDERRALSYIGGRANALTGVWGSTSPLRSALYRRHGPKSISWPARANASRCDGGEPS